VTPHFFSALRHTVHILQYKNECLLYIFLLTSHTTKQDFLQAVNLSVLLFGIYG